MISINVKNRSEGRFIFQIEDCKIYFSDLSIVSQVLQAFINYFDYGTGLCHFANECADYSLVLKNNHATIIEEGEKLITHYYSSLSVIRLADELIWDVMKVIEEYKSSIKKQDTLKEIEETNMELVNVLKGKGGE